MYLAGSNRSRWLDSQLSTVLFTAAWIFNLFTYHIKKLRRLISKKTNSSLVFVYQSYLFVSKMTTGSNRPDPFTSSDLNPITASSTSQTYDVVIIGAGIIGLNIARRFLLGSNLSVAVVDKEVPCAGATGAGIFFFNSINFVWLPRKCIKIFFFFG